MRDDKPTRGENRGFFADMRLSLLMSETTTHFCKLLLLDVHVAMPHPKASNNSYSNSGKSVKTPKRRG